MKMWKRTVLEEALHNHQRLLDEQTTCKIHHYIYNIPSLFLIHNSSFVTQSSSFLTHAASPYECSSRPS